MSRPQDAERSDKYPLKMIHLMLNYLCGKSVVFFPAPLHADIKIFHLDRLTAHGLPFADVAQAALPRGVGRCTFLLYLGG